MGNHYSTDSELYSTSEEEEENPGAEPLFRGFVRPPSEEPPRHLLRRFVDHVQRRLPALGRLLNRIVPGNQRRPPLRIPHGPSGSRAHIMNTYITTCPGLLLHLPLEAAKWEPVPPNSLPGRSPLYIDTGPGESIFVFPRGRGVYVPPPQTGSANDRLLTTVRHRRVMVDHFEELSNVTCSISPTEGNSVHCRYPLMYPLMPPSGLPKEEWEFQPPRRRRNLPATPIRGAQAAPPKMGPKPDDTRDTNREQLHRDRPDPREGPGNEQPKDGTSPSKDGKKGEPRDGACSGKGGKKDSKDGGKGSKSGNTKDGSSGSKGGGYGGAKDGSSSSKGHSYGDSKGGPSSSKGYGHGDSKGGGSKDKDSKSGQSSSKKPDDSDPKTGPSPRKKAEDKDTKGGPSSGKRYGHGDSKGEGSGNKDPKTGPSSSKKAEDKDTKGGPSSGKGYGHGDSKGEGAGNKDPKTGPSPRKKAEDKDTKGGPSSGKGYGHGDSKGEGAGNKDPKTGPSSSKKLGDADPKTGPSLSKDPVTKSGPSPRKKIEDPKDPKGGSPFGKGFGHEDSKGGGSGDKDSKSGPSSKKPRHSDLKSVPAAPWIKFKDRDPKGGSPIGKGCGLEDSKEGGSGDKDPKSGSSSKKPRYSDLESGPAAPWIKFKDRDLKGCGLGDSKEGGSGDKDPKSGPSSKKPGDTDSKTESSTSKENPESTSTVSEETEDSSSGPVVFKKVNILNYRKLSGSSNPETESSSSSKTETPSKEQEVPQTSQAGESKDTVKTSSEACAKGEPSTTQPLKRKIIMKTSRGTSTTKIPPKEQRAPQTSQAVSSGSTAKTSTGASSKSEPSTMQPTKPKTATKTSSAISSTHITSTEQEGQQTSQAGQLGVTVKTSTGSSPKSQPSTTQPTKPKSPRATSSTHTTSNEQEGQQTSQAGQLGATVKTSTGASPKSQPSTTQPTKPKSPRATSGTHTTSSEQEEQQTSQAGQLGATVKTSTGASPKSQPSTTQPTKPKSPRATSSTHTTSSEQEGPQTSQAGQLEVTVKTSTGSSPKSQPSTTQPTKPKTITKISRDTSSMQTPSREQETPQTSQAGQSGDTVKTSSEAYAHKSQSSTMDPLKLPTTTKRVSPQSDKKDPTPSEIQDKRQSTGTSQGITQPKPVSGIDDKSPKRTGSTTSTPRKSPQACAAAAQRFWLSPSQFEENQQTDRFRRRSTISGPNPYSSNSASSNQSSHRRANSLNRSCYTESDTKWIMGSRRLSPLHKPRLLPKVPPRLLRSCPGSVDRSPTTLDPPPPQRRTVSLDSSPSQKFMKVDLSAFGYLLPGDMDKPKQSPPKSSQSSLAGYSKKGAIRKELFKQKQYTSSGEQADTEMSDPAHSSQSSNTPGTPQQFVKTRMVPNLADFYPPEKIAAAEKLKQQYSPKTKTPPRRQSSSTSYEDTGVSGASNQGYGSRRGSSEGHELGGSPIAGTTGQQSTPHRQSSSTSYEDTEVAGSPKRKTGLKRYPRLQSSSASYEDTEGSGTISNQGSGSRPGSTEGGSSIYGTTGQQSSPYQQSSSASYEVAEVSGAISSQSISSYGSSAPKLTGSSSPRRKSSSTSYEGTGGSGTISNQSLGSRPGSTPGYQHGGSPIHGTTGQPSSPYQQSSTTGYVGTSVPGAISSQGHGSRRGSREGYDQGGLGAQGQGSRPGSGGGYGQGGSPIHGATGQPSSPYQQSSTTGYVGTTVPGAISSQGHGSRRGSREGYDQGGFGTQGQSSRPGSGDEYGQGGFGTQGQGSRPGSGDEYGQGGSPIHGTTGQPSSPYRKSHGSRRGSREGYGQGGFGTQGQGSRPGSEDGYDQGAFGTQGQGSRPGSGGGYGQGGSPIYGTTGKPSSPYRKSHGSRPGSREGFDEGGFGTQGQGSRPGSGDGHGQGGFGTQGFGSRPGSGDGHGQGGSPIHGTTGKPSSPYRKSHGSRPGSREGFDEGGFGTQGQGSRPGSGDGHGQGGFGTQDFGSRPGSGDGHGQGGFIIQGFGSRPGSGDGHGQGGSPIHGTTGKPSSPYRKSHGSRPGSREGFDEGGFGTQGQGSRPGSADGHGQAGSGAQGHGSRPGSSEGYVQTGSGTPGHGSRPGSAEGYGPGGSPIHGTTGQPTSPHRPSISASYGDMGVPEVQKPALSPTHRTRLQRLPRLQSSSTSHEDTGASETSSARMRIEKRTRRGRRSSGGGDLGDLHEASSQEVEEVEGKIWGTVVTEGLPEKATGSGSKRQVSTQGNDQPGVSGINPQTNRRNTSSTSVDTESSSLPSFPNEPSTSQFRPTLQSQTSTFSYEDTVFSGRETATTSQLPSTSTEEPTGAAGRRRTSTTSETDSSSLPSSSAHEPPNRLLPIRRRPSNPSPDDTESSGCGVSLPLSPNVQQVSSPDVSSAHPRDTDTFQGSVVTTTSIPSDSPSKQLEGSSGRSPMGLAPPTHPLSRAHSSSHVQQGAQKHPASNPRHQSDGNESPNQILQKIQITGPEEDGKNEAGTSHAAGSSGTDPERKNKVITILPQNNRLTVPSKKKSSDIQSPFSQTISSSSFEDVFQFDSSFDQADPLPTSEVRPASGELERLEENAEAAGVNVGSVDSTTPEGLSQSLPSSVGEQDSAGQEEGYTAPFPGIPESTFAEEEVPNPNDPQAGTSSTLPEKCGMTTQPIPIMKIDDASKQKQAEEIEVRPDIPEVHVPPAEEVQEAAAVPVDEAQFVAGQPDSSSSNDEGVDVDMPKPREKGKYPRKKRTKPYTRKPSPKKTEVIPFESKDASNVPQSSMASAHQKILAEYFSKVKQGGLKLPPPEEREVLGIPTPPAVSKYTPPIFNTPSTKQAENAPLNPHDLLNALEMMQAQQTQAGTSGQSSTGAIPKTSHYNIKFPKEEIYKSKQGRFSRSRSRSRSSSLEPEEPISPEIQDPSNPEIAKGVTEVAELIKSMTLPDTEEIESENKKVTSTSGTEKKILDTETVKASEKKSTAAEGSGSLDQGGLPSRPQGYFEPNILIGLKAMGKATDTGVVLPIPTGIEAPTIQDPIQEAASSTTQESTSGQIDTETVVPIPTETETVTTSTGGSGSRWVDEPTSSTSIESQPSQELPPKAGEDEASVTVQEETPKEEQSPIPPGSSEPSTSTSQGPLEPSTSKPQGPVEPSTSKPQGPLEPSISKPQGPLEPSTSKPQGPLEPSTSSQEVPSVAGATETIDLTSDDEKDNAAASGAPKGAESQGARPRDEESRRLPGSRMSDGRYYTPRQVLILEETFKKRNKPTNETVMQLSMEFGVSCKEIRLWFSKRRERGLVVHKSSRVTYKKF